MGRFLFKEAAFFVARHKSLCTASVLLAFARTRFDMNPSRRTVNPSLEIIDKKSELRTQEHGGFR